MLQSSLTKFDPSNQPKEDLGRKAIFDAKNINQDQANFNQTDRKRAISKDFSV